MELLIALVGIFLAIVFWLASPKSLRRRLGEYFSGLFRRHPAVTAEAYIDVFDGRVEILTDELLSHPADAARKKEFYEIAPLDWDIIAAHADVERDQQADVIEELTKPVDSLRFVCIHGESGSGKSTLAWRVAAQLHKVHRMLVIRVKDKEEPEVWYRMTEFCRRLRRPVCVLADDLFRHPEVCQALRELNPWLPLAILATSQTNEYPPGRLKGQIVSIHLGPPSFEEKKRVLHRLDQDLEDLTPDQLTRLRAANEFLVLMAELTFGKGFQDVVQDSLDNLLRRYEQMYHAYEYLCFAYSYGVATPASLLERLDAEGRFHDLPNREGAQGLVFCDEKRQELLRPGHQRRAETAQRLFERHRSSATVLRELMSVVEVSSPLERGFFARLLRTLASRKSEALDKALPHIEGMVAQCVQHAERISELTIWQAFYFALERSDEADRCVDYALALEPISSDDCNLLLRLYRKRGREREALPILDRWTQSHPELGGSRPAYLGLVERYSSERDQARVIHDTSAWLASHPDDNYVRRAYLGLVERKGTPGQTERVLKETPTWLHAHPNATDVWTRFISYLIASERFDDARALAEEIISIHSRNSNVVTHYLHLMQNHLEEERTRELYGSLIKLFPRDIVIRSVWARWLTTVNSGEEAEKVFKALIAEHPKSFDPHYGYGRLLLDMERYGEAADQFRQVLKIHPGHAMAHDGLAAALQGLGRRAEGLHDDSEAARLFTAAEREFKSAIYWAGVAQDRQAIFFTHLGWFYVDRKRWSDALAAFDQAAKEDPEYFGNYWGKGRAFVGLGQWRDALHALQTTLEKAPNTLGPPASDDISQLIERCELALTTDP
ncbi:MAG TPA: tetratricopeptide repeat protein [Desulfatiglandales bacterium]|nr:tetratricopeptide repeat protein [Desulfatiglandales bacterium]